MDGFLKVRVPLVQDLFRRCRPYRRPLQLRERRTGFHPVELFLVAHQDHAGQA